jgi:spore coat polysaccharide biosynthesis protein SpsF
MNVAIIQARMGSSRFPGKVLEKIQEKSILEIIVERLRRCDVLDKIVVASSNLPSDKPIWDLCEKLEYDLFVGNEHDVLDRFYQAALRYGATNVLRITGDCPLVDPDLVSTLYDYFLKESLDHAGLLTGAGAAFTTENRFPDGLDAEWMKFSALKQAAELSTLLLDREHVTSYLWRNTNGFKSAGLAAEENFSDIRVTVDNPQDLKMLQTYCKESSISASDVSFRDISRWIRSQNTPPDSQDFIGKENYGQFFGR